MRLLLGFGSVGTKLVKYISSLLWSPSWQLENEKWSAGKLWQGFSFPFPVSLLQHLILQTMKFCFLLLKHVWELLVLHLNASNRFNILRTTFNHPCGVRLEASPGLNNQPFIIYDQCVTTGYLSVIILITAWENAFTFGHTLTWIDWFFCYCCKNLRVIRECFLASVTNLLASFSNKGTCSLMFLFFGLGFSPVSVQNSRWSCLHYSSHVYVFPVSCTQADS